MKGFTLLANKKCMSGVISEGITGVIVTCKEGQCHVTFSSMDKSGILSYTWYAADLEEGAYLNICFEDVTSVSKAEEVRDYNKLQEEAQKESLELYWKLKRELIEEELIDEI